MLTPSLVRRFNETRDRGTDQGGCLPWVGLRHTSGYGIIRQGRRELRAHRVAWVLANGTAIPADQVVIHSCDTPLCINPAHLRVGTDQENVDDMVERGRAHWQRHPARHGTRARYVAGCRCDPCTDADVLYKRQWYRKVRGKGVRQLPRRRVLVPKG